jgi:hypothetical protein
VVYLYVHNQAFSRPTIEPFICNVNATCFGCKQPFLGIPLNYSASSVMMGSHGVYREEICL